MALVTQSEYARRRGVTRQAVSKAVKEGRIATMDGLIDPESADREWGANTDLARKLMAPPAQKASAEPERARPRHPTPHPRPAPDPTEPAMPEGKAAAQLSPAQQRYIASRAYKESYSALSAKLEYELQLGTLVRADDVRLAAFNAGRRARDLLSAVPDRCSQMAFGRSVEDIHRILTEEIERACKEVARWSQSPV